MQTQATSLCLLAILLGGSSFPKSTTDVAVSSKAIRSASHLELVFYIRNSRTTPLKILRFPAEPQDGFNVTFASSVRLYDKDMNEIYSDESALIDGIPGNYIKLQPDSVTSAACRVRLDKLHYYHNIFNVYGLPNRPHAPGEPGFIDADDYAEKSKHLNLKYYQLEYQDPWAKRKPYCRPFTSPLFTLE